MADSEDPVAVAPSAAKHHDSDNGSAISQHCDVLGDTMTESPDHIPGSHDHTSDIIDLTADDSGSDEGLPMHHWTRDVARAGKRPSRSSSISQELTQPLSVSDSLSLPATGIKISDSADNTKDSDAGPAHCTDITTTSRVGLHTMLEQMGENHGFQANVVNSVYKHSNGLQEADEILRVMREVAQKHGEQEIQHQSKRRKMMHA
ncbi:hypothetical protein V8E55_009400 [Tylopilus felleus]